nr:hypothetical protein BN993_03967 [Virgibacillus halodenitrificans]
MDLSDNIINSVVTTQYVFGPTSHCQWRFMRSDASLDREKCMQVIVEVVVYWLRNDVEPERGSSKTVGG